MCGKHTVTSCQFIGSDVDPRISFPVQYCGSNVVEGRSYCEDHLWKVYQKHSNTQMPTVNLKSDKTAAIIIEEDIKELEYDGFFDELVVTEEE